MRKYYFTHSTLHIVHCTLYIAFLLFTFDFAHAQSDSLAPKDQYRHFVMPTGKPVDHPYLGVWELAFLQGGFGIADIVSITAGITVMPTVSFKSQIGYVQAKFTLADEGGVAFALGANLLRMTSEFFYTHVFASATAEFQDETRYTGLIFVKSSGEEHPDVKVYPYGNFTFNYTGFIGAGIGFDKPIKAIPHTRFFAEIWNHDLSSAKNIALDCGIRIENDHFSSDFGLMYFAVPLLAPIANFVYRF